MAFRKRVYAGKPRKGGFKRSKYVGVRRKFSRSSRDKVSSTNGLRTSIQEFRGRKTSRRAYKNELWRSTQSRQHYRSVLSIFSTLPAAVVRTEANVYQLNMISNGFMFTTGGAQSPIGAATTWGNDFTLRGGVSTLHLTNPTTNADGVLVVTVYEMITIGRGATPAPIVSVDRAWDPSIDFSLSDQFKIMKKHKFIISLGETVEIQHRHRLRKWDRQHQSVNGEFIKVWYMTVSSDRGLGRDLHVLNSHNLSFTGDVVN